MAHSFESSFDGEFDLDSTFTAAKTIEEVQENSLRPQAIDEYIGQEKIKSNLNIYMTAAKKRGSTLDHVLLYGPAGLGKTTLSHIIANEMGAGLRVTSGPAIDAPADLASILTDLQAGDVLFIDEIHRLNKNIEEILYPAMEDLALDIIVGKGPMARSVRLPLEPFTLVGATTKAGMLSAPLRDRFGVSFRLELYNHDELNQIIKRSAKILGTEIDEEASMQIAIRSRGTPRIANRLLKRVRDFADYNEEDTISMKSVDMAMKAMEIDELGLDKVDLNLLVAMIENFDGGPVGLDTLSASTGEDKETIEDCYEPYLMQLGFLARTPRGRIVLKKGYAHLGYEYQMDSDDED